jgi:type IV pilus assembly protein PilC
LNLQKHRNNKTVAIDINQIKKKSKTTEKEVFSLSAILSKDISFGNAFDDRVRENFYSKLHTLLSSGIDIKTTLDLVEGEEKKKKVQLIYKSLKQDIINGSSLSEAMKKYPEFTPFEYYSVKIGEETGRLTVILSDIEKYYTRTIAQRRKFISAISYPVVVMLTALGAIYFMLTFLVPLFADIYSQFGGELPMVTKVILSLAKATQKFGLIALVVLAGVVYYLYTQRNKVWLRKNCSALLLKIPVVKEIYLRNNLLRFSSTMALMAGANIPLVEALGLMKKMIGFYPIESAIDTINADIYKGLSLHEALGKHSIFPSEMISLIKVGEEVNQLKKIFTKLSEKYTNEVTYRMEVLNNLLEPALIIFLGLVIGFILVAMYLPIFKLSTQMI